MGKTVCIKIPVVKPGWTSQVCGQVTYLQVGDRRVKCLRHRNEFNQILVTHFASGVCIINQFLMIEARLRSNSRRLPDIQKAAVEILIERYSLEVFYKNLDAASVINK
jgi:hypothetical protein